MRPLDIECDFESPGGFVFQPGAIIGRWCLGRRRALQAQDIECRHAWCAGHAFFAAHRLQTERLIENVQVVTDGVASIGIDHGDGYALALIPGSMQDGVVVRVGHRLRSEAPATRRVALRLRWRRRTGRHKLPLCHGRHENIAGCHRRDGR